jgi:acylphosphatase
MDRKAVEVVVTGRVQGVFFRARTGDEAHRRGVAGWVRNDPDGTVAARFEGAADAVDAMVAWCRTGPPRASVEDVRTEVVEPDGATGFRVLE